jgi:mRNA interferase YafQ
VLKIKVTNQFKKDYKLINKRGYDINKLMKVVEMLKQRKELPIKYKDHYLTGEYKRV